MSLKHKCHICLWLSLNLILVFSTTTSTIQTTTTTTTSTASSETTTISSSPAATTQTIDETTYNGLTSTSQSNVIATNGPAAMATVTAPASAVPAASMAPEVTPPATTVDTGDEVEKNPSSNMDNTTANEKTFDNDERHETDNVGNSNNRRTTPYLKNINLDDNDNHMSNEISDDDISSKLQSNGLYRIKIGEITTDEFDNGLTSSASVSSSSVEVGGKTLGETVVESTTMPAAIPMHKTSAIEKVDIDVFYPSKMEDFKPVIEQSNEKLIREKNILRNAEVNTDKLQFITNTILKPSDTMVSVNTDRMAAQPPLAEANQSVSTTNIEIELIEDASESVKNGESQSNGVVDITKALQEDDAVITNIEEKFGVDDFDEKKAPVIVTASTTSTTARTINIPNTMIPNFLHHDFIMRRVKKNDPVVKFNVFNATPVKKIDFANTKFNTDSSHGGKDHEHRADDAAKNGGKPEFSTTKFYNSKETNGETVAHSNNSSHGLHKIAVMQSGVVRVRQQLLHTNRVPATGQLEKITVGDAPLAPIEMNQTVAQPQSKTTATTRTTEAMRPTTIQQRDVKTITIQPTTATTDAADSATNKASSSSTMAPSSPATTTAAAKPVMHTLSHLQEKINALDCEISSVPMESNVWRGNETHELNLPTTTPEDCTSGIDCSPMIISWEGVAEIQSGDILIVEINDTQLLPATMNGSGAEAHHTTAAVYQVTRLGHEHCDITEGVLLDITPLVVDGKKLVTLYDKDLTEGINLLIVVSDPWGEQCVRLKVTVKSDNCGDNTDCSGKGVCFSNASMEGYECQCCSGFAGSHCEEIDACTPSPCTNNGICVDLSQGHEGNAYQCLCPYGYTGKNCQFESDPCNPSQCLNGGTCVGNSTHFRCDCVAGFAGPLCQHNLNECESSPCVHGICVDQEDGFRCFCQPGFSGELCNFEYNECESNPCINGGECIDHIGGFSCKCTRGYTGKRCHLKVDFCATDPCPDGHRCIDHGDDFTCECPGGRNGPDCNQVPRTLCNVNPCSNGGTCWTTEESFYCACRPGFTGKMCEDDFILETVVSSNEILSDLNPESIRAYEEPRLHGGTGSTTFGVHNAYVAIGTLAAAIMIVAVVVSTCYCTNNSYDKVHQSYRNFASKHQHLLPTFGRKNKASTTNRHWLSGKGNGNYSTTCPSGGGGGGGNNNNATINNNNPNRIIYNNPAPMNNHHHPDRTVINHRPLAMSLENDMYYTVDFSDSQNAPLIQ